MFTVPVPQVAPVPEMIWKPPAAAPAPTSQPQRWTPWPMTSVMALVVVATALMLEVLLQPKRLGCAWASDGRSRHARMKASFFTVISVWLELGISLRRLVVTVTHDWDQRLGWPSAHLCDIRRRLPFPGEF